MRLQAGNIAVKDIISQDNCALSIAMSILSALDGQQTAFKPVANRVAELLE